MPRPARLLLVLAGAALAGVTTAVVASRDPGAAAAPWRSFTDAERRRALTLGPLPVLPASPTNRWADDDRAAHFGQWLFFDEGFSDDLPISCATCHEPDRAFTDGAALGVGIQPLLRHTPTLLDVARQRWLFWDGRADSLWMQAVEPFEDPREYGSNRLRVVRRVHDDADLRAGYEAVFGPLPDLSDAQRFPADARPVPDAQGGRDHPHDRAWRAMTEADRAVVNRVFTNLGKAIAAYERRLVGGETAFDRFVRALEARTDDRGRLRDVAGASDPSAFLDPAAQRGLRLFVGRADCRTCHSGPMLSDGEFHANGVGPIDGGMPSDPGRFEGIRKVQAHPFNAAGRFSDDPDGDAAERTRRTVRSSEAWGQFRTPSLRHVALTAPYMREGQLADLEAVVRHYSTLEDAVMPGHHQQQVLRRLDLSEREIADLVAFLESLTGPGPDPVLLAAPSSPLPSDD